MRGMGWCGVLMMELAGNSWGWRSGMLRPWLVCWREAAPRCSQPATCRGKQVTVAFAGPYPWLSTYCAGPRSVHPP